MHVKKLILNSMCIIEPDSAEEKINNMIIDFRGWTGTKQITLRGKLMKVINLRNLKAPDGC